MLFLVLTALVLGAFPLSQAQGIARKAFPPAHEDVVVKSRLVSEASVKENTVIIGEGNTLLCNFVNYGGDSMNLTVITGSLHDPNNFAVERMNFSTIGVQEEVESTQEVTLAYRFKMPEDMPAQKLQMAMTLFYKDKDGEFYSNTYFNETVTFDTAGVAGDSMGLIKLAVSFAVGGSILYWLYAQLKENSKVTQGTDGQVTARLGDEQAAIRVARAAAAAAKKQAAKKASGGAAAAAAADGEEAASGSASKKSKKAKKSKKSKGKSAAKRAIR